MMNYSIFALLTFAVLQCLFLGAFGLTKCETGNITDLAEIRRWLDKTNVEVTKLSRDGGLAEWAWATNITPENEKKKIQQNAILAAKMKDIWKQSACMDCDAAKCSVEEKRRVNAYYSIDIAALSTQLFADYSNIQTTMDSIYSTAKVCRPKKAGFLSFIDSSKECLSLDPGITKEVTFSYGDQMDKKFCFSELTEVMAKSNDYCELQWAWEAWRNQTGPKMRGYYTSYVLLQNEAAKLNGYNDAKEMWTTPSFVRDETDFFNQFDQAWIDVLPLYKELHAYIRGKLMAKFGASNFPASNHIPAHLFGNMWAQDWDFLFPLVVPYPDAPKVDVTELLKKKGWDEMEIFRQSDLFFQSLGLDNMTDDFWANSVFFRQKPPIEMVCHASAWDFYGLTDFRIKMCTVLTGTDFLTVHHEMGHIQYYMQYKNQPIEFRNGANPGFHEAIGDLIALSVMTPTHYKAVGLLPTDFQEDEQTSLNSLMATALKKIAFLPFGYLMDKYRWDLFTRSTSFSDMNKAWWDLRCRVQGVSPPVPRTEDDFDPGAKYHIPASVPYDRYFFSYIAQFQFHRAICQKMGFQKDFHKCDIYKNKEATKEFRDAMALGSSTPYPEVLKSLTGSSKLDATAILDYFAPLLVWLKEQNKNNGNKVGWEAACSTIKRNNCDYNGASHVSSSQFVVVSLWMAMLASFIIPKM